jgi:hypothetical protein
MDGSVRSYRTWRWRFFLRLTAFRKRSIFPSRINLLVYQRDEVGESSTDFFVPYDWGMGCYERGIFGRFGILGA